MGPRLDAGTSRFPGEICDACDKRVPVVVVVGEKQDYDSATAKLCRECLIEALAILPAEVKP